MIYLANKKNLKEYGFNILLPVFLEEFCNQKLQSQNQNQKSKQNKIVTVSYK